MFIVRLSSQGDFLYW